jgi:hypothetical protein
VPRETNAERAKFGKVGKVFLEGGEIELFFLLPLEGKTPISKPSMQIVAYLLLEEGPVHSSQCHPPPPFTVSALSSSCLVLSVPSKSLMHHLSYLLFP